MYIGGNVVPHLQGVSITLSLLWTRPGLLCYAVNQITEPVKEKAPSVSDREILVGLTSLAKKKKKEHSVGEVLATVTVTGRSRQL